MDTVIYTASGSGEPSADELATADPGSVEAEKSIAANEVVSHPISPTKRELYISPEALEQLNAGCSGPEADAAAAEYFKNFGSDLREWEVNNE